MRFVHLCEADTQHQRSVIWGETLLFLRALMGFGDVRWVGAMPAFAVWGTEEQFGKIARFRHVKMLT